MRSTRIDPGQSDLLAAADLSTTTPARPIPGEPHIPPRPRQDADQPALFDVPATPEPPSLPYRATDPAPLAVALAGDAYGWLAAVLPDPAPVWCTAHRTTMRLTGPARLIYACERCDSERVTAPAVAA